ncbi:MAG TPA: GH116 family glycosyl hydrolase [Sedimentisphaerales bacterium]|nr:GH116 family glycosyl hydrolase [Sedimentisphaerales bacterium]HRS12109.1 GH116 family glycosyl hydrolase [Sedimentisphaerales bacterium]HRV48707.1 GH116 family glycosyl hydrolase [Sedimentisphaerales bacterium]
MEKQRVITTLSVAVLLWVSLTGAGYADEHLVPADKGFNPSYLQGLRERGERAVYAADEADTLGMPVGGIATGQMYLRSDGTLGLWHIFNRHIFTGYGAECYRTYRPDSPVESGFAVFVKSSDRQTLKPLNRDFGTVECAMEYPIGLVRYRADGFPVTVEMEAFSPFIPLNAKDSALPVTLFHITLKNTSNKAQEVSVLGWLENAVCFHSARSRGVARQTDIARESGRTLIVHTAKEPPKEQTRAPRPKIVVMEFEGPDYGNWQATGEAFGKGPAHGTLANQQPVSGFLGGGLVNTYLNGDRPHGTLRSPELKIDRRYINFLIGGGSHADETCINLIVDGQVVRTATGKDNEKLEWHFWNVEDLQGKTARIEIVDRHSGGWGHINIDQIELADEAYDADMGPFDKLLDYGSLVLAFDGAASTFTDRLLFMGKPCPTVETERIELTPGQTKTFTFVLTWFFPNHQNGHEYANRFDSAAGVAHYVLDNQERLSDQTRLWHRTFYEDSTLPRWLLFRLHSTVANLATGTCQWWRSGRFWAWEGVGCCEGTCTHVWNYAHAPARLFPELERSAREMQDFGEGFDPDSGLVGFRSNRAYAADGQAGTILKAYREHLCSADDAFLKRNWPRIRKALEFSIGQDGDENGLIENSQHNTFDINFEGPNTFVGSMYLAALRAGEEMAREMGDDAFARRCRRIFESGSRLTMERLWDGEYFIQLVDLDKHPKHQYGKGCLSDQLFGQGWAHQLRLGYIYPSSNVKEALRSIWKYNWAPDVGPYNAAYPPDRWFARPGEAGLFTCTWPKSEYMAEGVLYRNEVWTGIEYQVAGHMVWEGMVDEALAICRAVHDRYHPAKHNPFNEVECGDHYARAMASWGVFTALCGFEYHGPKGCIRFAPRMSPEDFRAAFTGAEGWGLFVQNRSNAAQRERIELRWGLLNLKSVAFCVPPEWKNVDIEIRCEGKTLRCTHSLDAGELRIELAEPVRLSAGQALDIAIRR